MTKEVGVLKTEDPTIILRDFIDFEDDTTVAEAVMEHPDYSDNYGNTMTENLGSPKQVANRRATRPNEIFKGAWKGQEFLGLISVTPSKQDPSDAEVGYFVRKKHSGNGYAKLMLKAVTPYAAERFSTFHAETHPGNTASIRALEDADYVQVSVEERTWKSERVMARIFEPKLN